jgi:hypothetical protein
MHKAKQHMRLMRAEIEGRVADRARTVANRPSQALVLVAHMAERTLRQDEGGTHPSRSARLKRKKRAILLPPRTYHVSVLLRHRQLAESIADSAGALDISGVRCLSNKSLRTWLDSIKGLNLDDLTSVLRELDDERAGYLKTRYGSSFLMTCTEITSS